ncbi:hypothetical protein MDA_GLEAN10012806 [Myotis davidii]|uniref:Uncharacterized protein n=1 Tax=Myotis davidii TaxID=225400 RepID=L5LJR4_MYODS|nr:hypothetical protein MDA_GLEAN10012806 [Myotis davidii]
MNGDRLAACDVAVTLGTGHRLTTNAGNETGPGDRLGTCTAFVFASARAPPSTAAGELPGVRPRVPPLVRVDRAAYSAISWTGGSLSSNFIPEAAFRVVAREEVQCQ